MLILLTLLSNFAKLILHIPNYISLLIKTPASQRNDDAVYWWRDSSANESFEGSSVSIWICFCVCCEVSERPGVSHHGSVLWTSWPKIWDLTCCRCEAFKTTLYLMLMSWNASDDCANESYGITCFSDVGRVCVCRRVWRENHVHLRNSFSTSGFVTGESLRWNQGQSEATVISLQHTHNWDHMNFQKNVITILSGECEVNLFTDCLLSIAISYIVPLLRNSDNEKIWRKSEGKHWGWACLTCLDFTYGHVKRAFCVTPLDQPNTHTHSQKL